MKNKLIIFDLDGTLFRTETIDIAAFNRAFRKYGLPEREGAEILELIGLTMEDVCKSLFKNADKVFTKSFTDDVIRLEKEEIAASGELYEGAVEMLKNLKKSGFRLGILSNGGMDYVMTILEKFRLSGLFDCVWADTPGVSKKQAIVMIKQMTEVKECIVVGDRIIDIEAAKANSCISIGVSYGFGGDEVFAADHVADSIAELEEIIKKIAV